MDNKKEKNELRELDGVYFRIERNGKYQSICFSDLTKEEMDRVLSEKNEDFLRNLCKILGKTIREIGDTFDIITRRE
jgi:hypothetical protein